MTTIDWKRKLSSRKLWAAVAGIVTGLAMVFGLDENTISTVAGAVVSVASVVAYIVAEGKVDAESVKNAVEGVQDAVEVVQEKPYDPDSTSADWRKMMGIGTGGNNENG